MTRIGLDFYYYNVNTFVEPWIEGTTIAPLSEYRKSSVGSIRWQNNFQYLTKAGWHFSYFGGLDRIRDKLQNFSHAADDMCKAALAKSDEELQKKINEKGDLFGRGMWQHRESNDPSLPKYFLDNTERFRHFTEQTSECLASH